METDVTLLIELRRVRRVGGRTSSESVSSTGFSEALVRRVTGLVSSSILERVLLCDRAVSVVSANDLLVDLRARWIGLPVSASSWMEETSSWEATSLILSETLAERLLLTAGLGDIGGSTGALERRLT